MATTAVFRQWHLPYCQAPKHQPEAAHGAFLAISVPLSRAHIYDEKWHQTIRIQPKAAHDPFLAVYMFTDWQLFLDGSERREMDRLQGTFI